MFNNKFVQKAKKFSSFYKKCLIYAILIIKKNLFYKEGVILIPNYINEWIEIIENMNTTTTYKLAWGKAIIDCIKDNNFEEKEGFILITIDSLAYNVLRYYWNQEYFFHLKQAGPQAKNKSIILEEVIKLINIYEQIVGSKNPIWFDRAVLDIKKHNLPKFNQAIRRIGKNLIDNPCKYFVHIGNEKYYYVYNLNANKNMILIKKCDASCLNEYANILIQIINYKWSQLLEEYNNAPKINQKVARASERKIRRKNLSNFIKYLILTSNNEYKDFYTGKILDKNDISVDHVIPWSFMYSDDIWNLVLTSKSYNSSKGNRVPTEEEIKLLNKRNIELLKVIEDIKYKEKLAEAINNNYVDKFYNNCKYELKY